MRVMTPRRIAFLALTVLLGTAPRLSADVVLDWNAAMTHLNESAPPPGNAPMELRDYAMAHIAMFNAINAATKGNGGDEAAAAQAAHDVLVKALPAGLQAFDALLADELGRIPDGPAKSAGIRAGAEAAAEILAARSSDGAADGEGPYKPGKHAGDYQFTPPFDGAPFNGYVLYPKLGKVIPFVLKSADQFRAPAPYTLRDPEYAFEYNEVKAYGARDSLVRSADQTETAEFWYEMSAFGWNRIARVLAAQRPDTLINHARLFATLNTAMIDAMIAGFDSKYTYNFWRPVTAIHEGSGDDNPFTVADPGWQPLMLTPPMPDYISTHASLGAAAAVVLVWFFQGDEHTFTLESTMVSQFPHLHPRTFHRITDAAIENAMSRVFAGIHFRFAALTGLEQGRKVGGWVVQNAPYTEGR